MTLQLQPSNEEQDTQLHNIGIDPNQVNKSIKNIEKLIKSILTFTKGWENSQIPNTTDITENTHTCTPFEDSIISTKLKDRGFFRMKENNQHNYDTPKGNEQISIKNIEITKDTIILTIESSLFSTKEHIIPIKHTGADISGAKNVTTIKMYDDTTVPLKTVENNGRTLYYNIPEGITIIWAQK